LNWFREAHLEAEKIRVDLQRIRRSKPSMMFPTAIPSDTVGWLADGFAEVEQHDIRVCFVAFHPDDYDDVIRCPGVDLETRAPFIWESIMGTLWEAFLFVSAEITPGDIYIAGGFETDPLADRHTLVKIR
jgi:hypothetical protein